MSQKIKLQSNDGEVFEVDIKVAKCCGTIDAMIDCCGLGDTADTMVVPLPNVTATILRKVLVWAEHHKDNPELPEPKIDLDNFLEAPKTTMSPFDTEFLHVDQETLFELLKASNYLDCKGLMNLAFQKLTGMLSGATVEQVQRMFRVPNE